MGKYQVGKTIGEGTFGKVKLAVNTETGEKMAIKVRPISVADVVVRACCNLGISAGFGLNGQATRDHSPPPPDLLTRVTGKESCPQRC